MPDLEEVSQVAEQYLITHNRKFYVGSQQYAGPLVPVADVETAKEKEVVQQGIGPHCFICKKIGHKAANCRSRFRRRCFVCDKSGHKAKDCWFSRRNADNAKPQHKAAAGNDKTVGGAQQQAAVGESREVSAECLVQSATPSGRQESSSVDLSQYSRCGCLALDSGVHVPFVSSACLRGAGGVGDMPVVEGKVGGVTVKP